jgi:hypothetical protein
MNISRGRMAIIENPMNHPMKVTSLTAKDASLCAYLSMSMSVKIVMRTH